MTRDDLKNIFTEELMKIAPDADLSGVGEQEDLRDALDLDSMDIMNLIIALHGRLGVDIPDREASRMVTLGGALDYLENVTS